MLFDVFNVAGTSPADIKKILEDNTVLLSSVQLYFNSFQNIENIYPCSTALCILAQLRILTYFFHLVKMRVKRKLESDETFP